MLFILSDASVQLRRPWVFNWSAIFMKTETTESEIVDKFLAKYDVERPTAEKDVASIIAQLRRIGTVIDEYA